MTTYYVMSREDRKPNGEKGRYSVSSRTWTLLKDAIEYKKSISSSREPKILVEVTVSDEAAKDLVG